VEPRPTKGRDEREPISNPAEKQAFIPPAFF
jgi:hypothetical protein